MLGASFTGCIEDDDSLTLRQSVEDLLQASEDQNANKFCGYILNYDGTFISGEDKQECIAMLNEDSGVEYAFTIQAFDSEKQDYKVNKNSGYVYSASMTVEVCYREQSDTQNGANEWICETMENGDMAQMALTNIMTMTDRPLSLLSLYLKIVVAYIT